MGFPVNFPLNQSIDFRMITGIKKKNILIPFRFEHAKWSSSQDFPKNHWIQPSKQANHRTDHRSLLIQHVQLLSNICFIESIIQGIATNSDIEMKIDKCSVCRFRFITCPLINSHINRTLQFVVRKLLVYQRLNPLIYHYHPFNLH